VINSVLSLVLPAYNEEANLEEVVKEALEEIPKSFELFEIIIVNDGSKDKTGEIADRLAVQSVGTVRVIHHNLNRGYGAALSSGFAAAQGDYLMFMDSDRQFKAEDIRLLAPYLSKADIIVGYRKKRHDPFYRFWIGYIFNTIITLFFGIYLRDIDCGFKIFRADVLKKMKLESPGVLINTEIHAKAQHQGRSIIEVGVNHYPRLSGKQSGASLRVIARAMKETILLWFRMQSYVPPQDLGISRNGLEHNNTLGVTRAVKPFPSFSLATAMTFFILVLVWRIINRWRGK